MIEDEHSIELTFDLPGFSHDDIKVDIKEDSISIEAEKKEEKKVDEKDFKSFEKSERTFSYYSSLPLVDKDKAKIDYIDDRLVIIIPKRK